MLEAQRAAFFAELPVSLAIRRDRLRRATLLIEQNGEALSAALVADRATQDAESAMRDELRPAVLVLGEAQQQLASWMRPEGRGGLLGRLGLGGDLLEYQPMGVVGIAAPAALPLVRTAHLLAGALAAGNRVMLRFDAASPRLAEALCALAPRYFDPRELVVAGEAFAGVDVDLLVTGDPGGEDSGPVAARSGKSAVILGRSARFVRAAARIIAAKRCDGGQSPLAPDYLLVPEAQEGAIAAWLWRAAVQPAGDAVGPSLSAEACDRLALLLDDARARGGEVMTAEPRGGGMPLHIIRHATPDMQVMREEIAGPILPLANYARIEDAIAATHRLPAPPALYYVGRDSAERRRVTEGTLSSLIASEARMLAAARGAIVTVEARPLASAGEAGFRRFSRVRQICRRSWPGTTGTPARGAVDELAEVTPVLR
jgi:coniferyl-aldehyde dehydrogenase